MGLTSRFGCAIIHGYTERVCAALAQPDRVPGYEPVGRGFESLMPRHNKRAALVAALLLCHSTGAGEPPSGRF